MTVPLPCVLAFPSRVNFGSSCPACLQCPLPPLHLHFLDVASHCTCFHHGDPWHSHPVDMLVLTPRFRCPSAQLPTLFCGGSTFFHPHGSSFPLAPSPAPALPPPASLLLCPKYPLGAHAWLAASASPLPVHCALRLPSVLREDVLGAILCPSIWGSTLHRCSPGRVLGRVAYSVDPS